MAETLDKETLKALSTDTRQEIVKLLSKRPHTASEMAKIMNKHVTTITEHLNMLEKTSLIYRKDSTNKWIYYALTDKGQKIFKPAYYTWVITLSVVLVAVVIFSLYQTFSTASFESVSRDSQAYSVNPIFVGVGDIVQEAGKTYVPLTLTDSHEKPVSIELGGEITNNGIVPLYISPDSTQNFSVKIYPLRTVGNKTVVPVEISQNKKTSEHKASGSKQIAINIIDSIGNKNSFPYTIP